MCFNKLVNTNYKYGSLKRKLNKGYNSYYHLMFSDIYIDVTNENRIVIDHWMKGQLNSSNRDTYETYIKEIDSYIYEMEKQDDKSDEELYNDIIGLRSKYIENSSYTTDINEEIKYINEHNKDVNDVTDLIFYDDNNIDKNTLIDESDKYIQLLQEKEALLIVPESYKQLPVLINYIKDLCSNGKKIFILLKKEPNLNMASYEHYRNIKDDAFNQLIDDNKIQILIDSSSKYGFDYEKLDCKYVNTIEKLINENKIFALGFGEHALLGIKDFNIESIVMTKIESFRVREITLLLDGIYNYAVVYIPKNFNIYNYIIHNERSKLTFYQLSQICKKNNYDNDELMDIDLLYRKYPQYFFNIYSTEDTNQDLKKMPCYDVVNYSDFINKKDKRLVEYINKKSDKVNYFKRYYDLDNMKVTSFDPIPEENKHCVTIDGIILDGKAQAEVIIKKNKSDSNDIRSIAKTNNLDNNYLLFNFMFFLTPKVSILYNNIRKDRKEEQIKFNSGHMDYKYYKSDDHINETFPLYNKACIGLTEDGKFQFFNKQLKGGKINVNDFAFNWQEDCVNTEANKDVKVFTPYLSNGTTCDNYSDYQKEVGHDRYNIVIVNEYIISMRRGNVIVPPVGVVVSINEKLGNDFVKSQHLVENENGYYDVDKLSYSLELDKDMNEDYKWIFGGGLTIVKDNINLFKNKEIGNKILQEEGWLSPLSMQTQESNIHELSRHPRTAFGMTSDNKFFGVVYSGRTRENAGVNYVEMADIALKEFKDIKFMVNVDGGASSLLALIMNKELIELNYPGSSPSSTAGMARPVNSMLIMEI